MGRACAHLLVANAATRALVTCQGDGATCAYMTSVLFIIINIAWCVWMVLGLKGLGEFSGGEARRAGGAGGRVEGRWRVKV